MGAGRKSGETERSVKRAWQKTMEREWEVAERERSGEGAGSAAHSPLRPNISPTSRRNPHSTVCSLLFQPSLFYSTHTRIVTCSNPAQHL